MKITASQLRRIISEEVSAAISESPIFAASSIVGMKGKGGGAPKLVTLKTASGDHEVLNVDQKTGKMRVRKKGSSASPFDVSSSDVKQVVEGRRSVKSLLEGHARITEEEMAAWKSGDLGFTSQHAGGHDHQEFLHGHESGHPGDDEGDMVKTRMASLKKMAAEICDMLDPDDQLPAWVQDLLATSHNDVRHVHDYLSGVKGSAKHPMGESRLSEGHSRITEDEVAAWKRGEWGFVSEHDGGGPRRLRGIPADPAALKDYIIRTYQGHCYDLGCDDVSDPVFKDYVADELAGQVDSTALQRALAMI